MKKLILILCAFAFLGCTKTSSNSINSSTSNQVDVNQNQAIKEAAISPDGKFFESLTSDSNYFDVIKLIGTPDSETDLSNLGLSLPLLLGCYGEKNLCVFFVNDRNPKDKGVKSKYNYVGTLKINPSEILHSAKPQYLDLLESIRTEVIKKEWDKVAKKTKEQK